MKNTTQPPYWWIRCVMVGSLSWNVSRVTCAPPLRPPSCASGQAQNAIRLWQRVVQLGSTHPLPLQSAADLVEYRGIVNGRRHGPGVSVGNLFHRPAQDLARACLWQPRHCDGELERGDRADLVAHQRHDLLLDFDR